MRAASVPGRSAEDVKIIVETFGDWQGVAQRLAERTR